MCVCGCVYVCVCVCFQLYKEGISDSPCLSEFRLAAMNQTFLVPGLTYEGDVPDVPEQLLTVRHRLHLLAESDSAAASHQHVVQRVGQRVHSVHCGGGRRLVTSLVPQASQGRWVIQSAMANNNVMFLFAAGRAGLKRQSHLQ